MSINELILVCYLLCIIAGASGLTVALLSNKKRSSSFGKAVIYFIAGMLIMCFYDMAIYYCDYVI